ncbi:MAG: flippase [Ignavibacteriaceae bacterium]|nr:flippase [bacterium BMS3Abin03]
MQEKNNIKTKIDFSSESFKKYFTNTSWLFFERILRIIISFIVTIYIVRYLGPKDFGLYSYVISFSWLFGAFSTLGLEAIAVREIVKYPDKQEEINGTVFTLRLLGGIIAIVLIASTVFITGEEFYTSILILIASVSFIFQSFSVIEYFFRAIVKAKYNAYALSTSVICSSLLKILLILIKAPLIYFIIAFSFEYFVLAIGYLLVYKRNKLSVFNWKFSKHLSKSLLKDSWPLMLSGIVVMIYMRIDQIMIKNMINDEAVGYYAASVRLCEAWYFIPVTLCNSIFPAIVNAKNVSEQFYNNRLQKLYDLLAWLAIGISIPVTIFSRQIISILYGTEYINSAPVLTIYIWAGVAVFLGVASSQYLINENLTKLAFVRNLIGMIVNVILNFLLIPGYGIIGAAIATLISYTLLSFVLSFKKDFYQQFKMMLKSVFLITFFQYITNVVINKRKS